jgi:hypothetical protein
MSETIILVFLFVLLALTAIFGIRNNEVYGFVISLNDILHDELTRILLTYSDDNEFNADSENYDRFQSGVEDILSKLSYNRMVFTPKPLKLSNWLSEEDISFIQELKRYRIDKTKNT